MPIILSRMGRWRSWVLSGRSFADANGRFRLGGLASRDVHHPRTPDRIRAKGRDRGDRSGADDHDGDHSTCTAFPRCSNS